MKHHHPSSNMFLPPYIRSSIYLYIIVVVLCTILPLPASPTSSASSVYISKSSNQNVSSSFITSSTSTFIIGFKEYHMQQQHEAFLNQILGPQKQQLSYISSSILWSHIERHNLASQYPTDFSLIEVETQQQQQQQEASSLSSISPSPSSVLSSLLSHPGIKYVSEQRQYRQLLALDEIDELLPVNVDASPPIYDYDPYTTYDRDPLNVGSFARPRRFSTHNVEMTENDRTDVAADTYYDDEKDSELSDYRHYRNIPNSTRLAQEVGIEHRFHHRRLCDINSNSVSRRYNADQLWSKGFRGGDIRIAIFDTGLSLKHSHFRRIKERSNWTDNDTLDDELGHGTHVAGVIASQSSDCAGFAPDAELYIFRVFNSRQLSFTSWFLDAFNYAIYSKVNVLNLSIGGPDFLDAPFVDKVLEMSANGIIVVSAIGNDGPLYGTLNNPADQMDVIGVGGLNADDTISYFSSRGMTTWELPTGYGRVKPDVVALANGVMGSKIPSGCKAQTGTSVASPVVAGAVVLLASTIPAHLRPTQLNPARLKQALVSSADRVNNANIFEQGAGKLDLIGAYEYLANTSPQVSVFPSNLDLTDCPYMWPYCIQPLYYSALPIIVNVTLLNSISVASEISEIIWTPDDEEMNPLAIEFTFSDPIWPWSGYVAVHFTVMVDITSSIIATGTITITVLSDKDIFSTLSLPVRVSIIPTPSRSRRILWDQFHNLRYPSGYFPRDNLEIKTDTLDWNGDHPHTNFKEVYNTLRDNGYYLEVLGEDYTCFNASLYSTLMIVDPEEEFFPVEISKLSEDILYGGLSILVMADWYNLAVMKQVKFWDENTASWWTPETGGSNIPALNNLLAGFNIAFSHHVLKGKISINESITATYSSGTTIARFPHNGHLLFAPLTDAGSGSPNRAYPILGLVQTKPATPPPTSSKTESGRIVVFGDSNCLDLNSNHNGLCLSFLLSLLQYTTGKNAALKQVSPQLLPIDSSVRVGIPTSGLITSADISPNGDYHDSTVKDLPQRMSGSNLMKYSKVISSSARSHCDAQHKRYDKKAIESQSNKQRNTPTSQRGPNEKDALRAPRGQAHRGYPYQRSRQEHPANSLPTSNDHLDLERSSSRIIPNDNPASIQALESTFLYDSTGIRSSANLASAFYLVLICFLIMSLFCSIMLCIVIIHSDDWSKRVREERRSADQGYWSFIYVTFTSAALSMFDFCRRIRPPRPRSGLFSPSSSPSIAASLTSRMQRTEQVNPVVVA